MSANIPPYPSSSSVLPQIERFYDRFLQNFLVGRVYRLRLRRAPEVDYLGIPTAGSVFNPLDPNAVFHFVPVDESGRRIGRSMMIPFADLIDAEPLSGSP